MPQVGDAARSPGERLCLAAVCALAVGLRWHHIGQLSLVHFDEGVLVSGAFGVWLNGLWHFPLAQPLQAPPLFPWMVAATFGITSTPWPIMGIYLSAALGAATIVVYFALLRRLYGGKLALVAAALLAASDLHVAFSRMALTDVPLTFWFVTGGYFLIRLVQVESGERARHVFWGLALGLATGAAWNTKYNGWMLLAMAATTAMIVAARDELLVRIRRRAAEPIACPGRGLPGHAIGSAPATVRLSRTGVVLAIALSAVVAVACFTPWYLYVERTYPGGYGAVTENHLRYVGQIYQWPVRAARLWSSLSAFRHFGWLTTLVAVMLALGLAIAQGRRANPSSETRGRLAMLLLVLVALAGLAAAVAMGTDALILVLATTAIVPALVWGRWPEVFFAVWTGAFIALTPFYHPYTRLLVPVLPAAIALAMWFVASAMSAMGGNKETIHERLTVAAKPATARTARLLLALVCLGALGAAVGWHPLGWLPSRDVWNRWSTRQSYRALGDAVLDADLPSDAMVLCQGPPAMTLYIERPWTPLETVPFDLWLTRVDRGRECYLAVDFWGAYGENHQLALRAIRQRLDCLELVAVVPNDLNLPTLLDYLPAAAVADHLSRRWPLKRVDDARGRAVVMPADLDEPFANIIALYRIDRGRLSGILDKTPASALK
jgi:dolichyl-phosphate-mannose-protein mannosyltransferase